MGVGRYEYKTHLAAGSSSSVVLGEQRYGFSACMVKDKIPTHGMYSTLMFEFATEEKYVKLRIRDTVVVYDSKLLRYVDCPHCMKSWEYIEWSIANDTAYA